jgi:hypothetical protein
MPRIDGKPSRPPPMEQAMAKPAAAGTPPAVGRREEGFGTGSAQPPWAAVGIAEPDGAMSTLDGLCLPHGRPALVILPSDDLK